MNTGTGETVITKSPTTRHDFSLGVMNAIGEAAKLMNIPRKELLGKSAMLKHGTTIGTNAVITGKGAKVGVYYN